MFLYIKATHPASSRLNATLHKILKTVRDTAEHVIPESTKSLSLQDGPQSGIITTLGLSWNFNLTSSHKCRFLAIWALEISPGIPRYNGEPNQYHASGWYSKSGWYFWSNYPWQLMSQNWNILNVLQWVIENGFRVIQVSNSVKNAVFLAWSAPLWWIKNWNVFSIAHKVICSC